VTATPQLDDVRGRVSTLELFFAEARGAPSNALPVSKDQQRNAA